jgi:hypothetical protein
MWQAFLEELGKLLAFIGILLLISLPGWAALGLLYFLGHFFKALGVEVP